MTTVEMSYPKLIGIGIGILGLGYLFFTPGVLTNIMGQQQYQQVYQTPLTQDNSGNQLNQGGNDLNQQPIVVTTAYVPFQLGTTNMYLMDKANPKNGVASVELEVLELPASPYTQADLEAIASDPNRDVLDEDTSTDANGLATMTGNKIMTTKDYLYAVRGSSSTVYDKLLVTATPQIPADKSTYSFPEKIYVYQVGSFEDIVASGATNSGIISFNDSGHTGSLNTTLTTGSQYAYFDMTIGGGTTGKYAKDPVFQMHYTEAKDFPSGAISSIYITKRTGSDYDFGGLNYADYVDSEYPIQLKGDLAYDADEKSYYMSVADSSVVRIKITWDAALAVAGDELKICVDDNSDFIAKSPVSRDAMIASSCFTLTTADS